MILTSFPYNREGSACLIRSPVKEKQSRDFQATAVEPVMTSDKLKCSFLNNLVQYIAIMVTPTKQMKMPSGKKAIVHTCITTNAGSIPR